MSIKVSIDASGGDFGFPVTISAGINALISFSDLHINFVGDEKGIKEELEKKGTAPKSDKKYECVFVKVGDKAKLRVVKTGIQDDSNIEIMSGLQPGEEIIIGPYTTVSKDLTSNDKVRVASENDKKDSKK